MTSNEEEPSLKNFVDNNYQLFTVIAAFGALSAYLSNIGNGDSEIIKFGIGASLILFLLTSLLGTYQAFIEAEKARKYENYRSFLLVVPFGLFIYSFFGIALAVFGVLFSRYPDQGISIILSGVIFATATTYVAIIFTTSWFRNTNSGTRIGRIYWISPWIGLLLTIGWGLLKYQMGEIPDLTGNIGGFTGIVFGNITIHFICSLLVFDILAVADLAISKQYFLPFGD